MKIWKPLAILSKWVLILVYLFVALSFASRRENQTICSGIDVTIQDSLQNAFITRMDVLKEIEKQHSNLVGIPLSMINTLKIEESIGGMDAVSHVTAYKTVSGKLSINIEQRKPMVRFINRKGQSYYVDNEGKILPLSKKYTSHVMIINGNIEEPQPITNNSTVSHWKTSGNEHENPLIYQLYNFAKYLNTNKFWASQISQIYVSNSTNIELIPRVGSHTIMLGSLEDYKSKMENLKLFYEKAAPNEGWNKYKEINLKFRNQIVCTKK